MQTDKFPNNKFWLGITCFAWLAAIACSLSAVAGEGVPAPEFTRTDADTWLNSEPLTLADLRGQVILLDVWTYGCGNCRRSIPWLKHLEEKYSGWPFRIIGIHTPEFPRERLRLMVESQLEALGIGHPVMLDNDYAYWKALHNQYWPTFYIMDQQGRLVASAVGETHEGEQQAVKVEQVIERLLADVGG